MNFACVYNIDKHTQKSSAFVNVDFVYILRLKNTKPTAYGISDPAFDFAFV